MNSKVIKRILIIIITFILGLNAMTIKVLANESSSQSTFNSETGETTINISVKKELQGGNLSEGDFEFALKTADGDNSKTVATTTNDINGNATFTFNLTQEEIKTMMKERISVASRYDFSGDTNEGYLVFTVEEIIGNNSNIIYDDNIGYIVIPVTKTGETYNVETNETMYAKVDVSEYGEEFYNEYISQVYHATDEELEGQAYAVYNSIDKSLTFFRDEAGKYTNNQYEGDVTYYTNFEDGSNTTYRSYRSQIKSVIFRDAIRPTAMDFSDFSECEWFDLQKLDTSLITSMSYMFRGCKSVEIINLSSMDTSKVTYMNYMFRECENLKTVILGDGWDTSKVANFNSMFFDAKKLQNIDLSKFETDSLTNADAMFSSVTSLKYIDMSNWTDNTNYSTASLFNHAAALYTDARNFCTFYSADLNLKNVKILLMKDTEYSYRANLRETQNVIEVKTGDYYTSLLLEDAGITFQNKKRISIDFKKVNSKGAFVEGAELVLMEGNGILKKWTSTNEAVTLNSLKYNTTYTIKELTVPEGYKQAEDITFYVDENGNIIINNEIVREIKMVEEDNNIEFSKKWLDEEFENLRPESVVFDLYNAEDELVKTVTLTTENEVDEYTWKGTFENVPNEYPLTIKEHPVDNYTTVYGRANADGYTIINDGEIIIKNKIKNPTKIPVTKIWDDEGYEYLRPESISFSLYKSTEPNEAIASITLNKDNALENDENTWAGMFMFSADSAYEEYIIKENSGIGYTPTYERRDEANGIVVDIDALYHPHAGSLYIVYVDEEGNLQGFTTNWYEIGANQMESRSIKINVPSDEFYIIVYKNNPTINAEQTTFTINKVYSGNDGETVAFNQLPKSASIPLEKSVDFDTKKGPLSVVVNVGETKVYHYKKQIENISSSEPIEGATIIKNKINYSDAVKYDEITIVKIDENEEQFDGAIFGLYDSTGKEISTYQGGKFTISTEDSILQNYLPATGESTILTLKEIKTADGYVLPSNEYTVKITATETEELINNTFVKTKKYNISIDGESQKNIKNTKTTISISKVDKDTKENITGAVLQIIDGENVIDEWTSSDSNHNIYGLIVGKKYTLHEKVAPDGYIIAKDIDFTIENLAEIQNVEMINDYTKIEIIKEDENGNALSGANLQLINEKGEVVHKWISISEAEKISKLPVGKYVIREVSAPDGYVIGNDVIIEVQEKETVQVFKFVNMEEKINEENSTVVVEEDAKDTSETKDESNKDEENTKKVEDTKITYEIKDENNKNDEENKESENIPSSPQTGDSILKIIVLLSISVVVLVGISVKVRKNNKKKKIVK